MGQKVLKIGTSAGLTIPKQAMHDLKLRIGERIVVTWDKTSGVLSAQRVGIESENKELLDWMEKFIKRYGSAMKALAKQGRTDDQRTMKMTYHFIQRHKKDLEALAKQ